MMKIKRFAVLLGVLLTVACTDDLMIPDYNNEELDDLRDNPTRAGVISASVGLLASGRDEFDDRNGYVSLLGILGRESYNFDGSDPRFITEMLGSALNASSPAFGGNLWSERYSNIRTGHIILDALEALDPAEMTDEEREGIRGFVKTVQAHEFLLLVNTRDVNGIVIDVNREPTGSPGDLVAPGAALNFIDGLLDEAADHLAGAGSSFPMPLTSGFSGFDTPASFLTFNRALAARVNAYQGEYGEALQDLDASFLDVGAPLDLGVYHVFGTTPGDVGNELFDPGSTPDILAHPSLVADADLMTNGQPDLRLQNKIRQVSSQTQLDITTDVAFRIYNTLDAPIPIIRNEELILLRAEAYIMTAQTALAADDINFIRQTSGGLPERTDLDATNILDELLQQRRYSLMFEGGHRWIDARRFDRLADLPLDLPDHVRNAAFPIPEAECLARGLEATGGVCG